MTGDQKSRPIAKNLVSLSKNLAWLSKNLVWLPKNSSWLLRLPYNGCDFEACDFRTVIPEITQNRHNRQKIDAKIDGIDTKIDTKTVAKSFNPITMNLENNLVKKRNQATENYNIGTKKIAEKIRRFAKKCVDSTKKRVDSLKYCAKKKAFAGISK